MPSNNVCTLLIASSHDFTCMQRFKVLSEAERTAALYSLLTFHSNADPLLCFISPAADGRADPMTTL